MSYNQWRLRQVTSILQSKHGRREIVREGNASEKEAEKRMEARQNSVIAGPTGEPLMLLGVIAGGFTFRCATISFNLHRN